jgi:hypothetical protein
VSASAQNPYPISNPYRKQTPPVPTKPPSAPTPARKETTQKSPAMAIDPLKSDSTNAGRDSGQSMYDRWAESTGNPLFNQIEKPKAEDVEANIFFQNLVKDYANYMPNARQQNGEYYAPGTAKNMFSRFWNALISERRFTGVQTPDWYKGLCGNIEKKARNNEQGRGVVGNDRVKGAIRAHSMVKVVMETLKNSNVRNAAENFTKW